MVHDVLVDSAEIKASFDDVFDQAIVFHGFADYMRDYDVYIYATADPRSGINSEHLRYRFQNSVRVTATSAVPPQIWGRSLDDRLLDPEQGDDLDGYVWGVRWQVLYPGMTLLTESDEAESWSQALGVPFHEADIRMNGHNLSLVFADLKIDVIDAGYAPFVVPGGGPEFKYFLT